MVDFLQLLTILRVPNVPSSWHKLKENIKKAEDESNDERRTIDATLDFCPDCEQESAKPDRCTNQECVCHANLSKAPHTFLVMNVKQQIEQLFRSIDREDLHLNRGMTTSSLPMTDVYHGQVYRSILRSLRHEEHNSFVSLSCNIDGVAVYTSSEQSMWTFTACLNELERSIRFDLERIVGNDPIYIQRLYIRSFCSSLRNQRGPQEAFKGDNAEDATSDCFEPEGIAEGGSLSDRRWFV